MTKYSLELDEQTADLLMAALDLYSRIGTGQMQSLFDHPDIQKALHTRDQHEARYAASRLKEVAFGFDAAVNLSIGSPNLMATTQQAYDIFCVLRHRLAWDKVGNPSERSREMLNVAYDKPPHVDRSHALPVFKKIEET